MVTDMGEQICVKSEQIIRSDRRQILSPFTTLIIHSPGIDRKQAMPAYLVAIYKHS